MTQQLIRYAGADEPAIKPGLQVEFQGQTRSLLGWSKRLGIPLREIRERIQLEGMTPQEALAAPYVPSASDDPKPISPTTPTVWLGGAKYAPKYSHDGITDTLGGWARRLGVAKSLLYSRLKRGMTLEEAMTTPSRQATPAQAVTAPPIKRGRIRLVRRATSTTTTTPTPGGQSETFTETERTGGGSSATHLHSPEEQS